MELQARWIILDDRAARRLAQSLGLPVIGTLGLLLADTNTFAAAVAKLAGRELNVSPWSFRRLVEFDAQEAIVCLFDDLEGGSGNARRLAELLPRWSDPWG